jgi:hypothetical protein
LEVAEEEDLRPRRRKRKRRRPQLSSRLSFGKDSPTYLRWVIALGVYGACGMAIVGWMIASGQVLELIIGGITWCMMMVISVGILIASMFISSALAGGIDFGDFFTAIAKSFFLLAPINFLYLLPLEGLGFLRWFLVLPIWTFGLMALFGLDLWEARFLISINWLLNLGGIFVLFMAVTSFMEHRRAKALENGFPEGPGQLMSNAPPWTTDDIRKMGGTVEQDANDPERPVTAISLHIRSFGDRELSRLIDFSALVSLDLSGTGVTDDGLILLLSFPRLQTLTLTNTKVTDSGIKRLKDMKPGLKVIR